MFDANVMRMSVPIGGFRSGIWDEFGQDQGLEHGWMIWKGKCTLCSLVFVDEEGEWVGEWVDR